MPPDITDINQLDLSKQYSYADYLTWKFTERVELIRGWISRMSPAPNRMHQHISFKMTLAMSKAIGKGGCKMYAAPFDVRLIDKKKSSPDREVYTVVQPDLCLICDESKLDEQGAIGAPDWIIEILSPGNTKKETQVKFELYEEAGVREYWIVQPGDQNILVFDLVDEKYKLRKIYTNEDEVPIGIHPGGSVDFREVFE